MNEEKQKIINKIQKVMIQAEDQAGTPEGDAFKRKAALLMSKYRIEETELDLGTDNFVYDTFEWYKDCAKMPQWVAQIVNVFCHTFDCKNVYRDYDDYREWEIFGTFSDVETVIYFVDVVCAHIERESRKTFPQKTYSGKRQQFGNVASTIIWERAYGLKNQMDTHIHEEEGCTALVLQKIDGVKEAVDEMYPKIKKARKKKFDMPNDRETWEAGRKAGETAPLNFAIEGEEDAA